MLWNFNQLSKDWRTATICSWDAWQQMKGAPHDMNSTSCKRSQPSEVSSSRWSEAPECKYHGCDRPCYPKAPGMYYEFCGITHADMHMVDGCDSAEYCIVMPYGHKRCKREGCEKAVASTNAREHDFCCISDMLEYTTWSTARYHKMGKLCKIENCFRHVYVESNGRCHKFCGLKHAKLAAAAKGAEAKGIRILAEESGEEMNSNSDQDQNSRDRNIISAPENIEDQVNRVFPTTDCYDHNGYEGAIGDQQLKDYLIASQEKLLEEQLPQGMAPDNNPNKIDIFHGPHSAKFVQINIFQGADISEFHPWEVVLEPKPRYLLNTITSKSRVIRKTRDDWCWKQTGPRYTRHSGLTCTYFSYKRKGKHGDSSKKQKNDSWTLHEYSLKDAISKDLAQKKGININKFDRIRKPVILKIARGDNAGRGEEDYLLSPVSSRRYSTPQVPEQYEGGMSRPFEQRQSSCDEPYLEFPYDNDLPQPQTPSDYYEQNPIQSLFNPDAFMMMCPDTPWSP